MRIKRRLKYCLFSICTNRKININCDCWHWLAVLFFCVAGVCVWLVAGVCVWLVCVWLVAGVCVWLVCVCVWLVCVCVAGVCVAGGWCVCVCVWLVAGVCVAGGWCVWLVAGVCGWCVCVAGGWCVCVAGGWWLVCVWLVAGGWCVCVWLVAGVPLPAFASVNPPLSTEPADQPSQRLPHTQGTVLGRTTNEFSCERRVMLCDVTEPRGLNEFDKWCCLWYNNHKMWT